MDKEARKRKKKADQLGMDPGTAASRLRKMVLFKVLKDTGQNVCFHCSGTIETAEELSIEHKIAWLDNDPELFWDLDNVGFSHHSCNCGAGRRPTGPKNVGPPETAWCSKCKAFVPQDQFGAGNSAHCRDLRYYCNACRKDGGWN